MRVECRLRPTPLGASGVGLIPVTNGERAAEKGVIPLAKTVAASIINFMTVYQCNVTPHGQRQLELDVKYPLTGDEKHKRYQLDLFVFSPYQLGMTYENYGVSRFLRDMRSYTRYSVYSIPLQKLADPSCAISPITASHPTP